MGLERLPFRIIRELEVAAVVQVIDKVEVTSKHGELYEIVKAFTETESRKPHEETDS